MKLSFGRTPLIMGVLNVTPDSFSDGGRYNTLDRAVRHAREMIDGGADIIDVGGESTRPGSNEITAGEEIDRVLPVIDALINGFPGHDGIGIPISIDTKKPEVANEAIKRGCLMVNDVSAASDPQMLQVLRKYGDRVPIVLMHKQGDPKTMQEDPFYEDVLRDVSNYLSERAASLVEAGIEAERIIIDPGIGFGKRFRDNLELLKNIDSYDRLCGSLAVAARCYQQGVEIVRVHDVRETAGLFRVLEAMEHPADCKN
jgi:dihydropteroate synthase